MKLISTEFGQSFQPFLIDELRPLTGGLYLPGLIAAVAERYKFATVPTAGDALQQGAKFAEGALLFEGQVIAIRQLSVFNDGIIVVAWNTDDSDLILKDMMFWATQTFQLREPITKLPTQHVSNVVVEFDLTIERAFNALSKFMKVYEAVLKATYNWDYPIEPTRIAFGADTTKMPQHTSADFVIERRAGRPFAERRYFSSVRLRTSAHLELLGQLEDLIREIGN
jgi:hypothetical protein